MGIKDGLRRLPEKLIPDGAGLRSALKEHRQEHKPGYVTAGATRKAVVKTSQLV